MDINLLGRNEEEIQEPEIILAARNFPPDDLGFFKYARVLVYILVFLVPLFFLTWTSETLEFNKQFLIFILGAAGLILYLGQVIRTGHLIIKRSLANYAVLAFLAAVLLVSFFSDSKYQSIFGGFSAGFYESLISSIGFAILFFLVLNVFGTNQDSAKEDASKLLSIFYLSIFIAVLAGVLQMFGLPVFKLFGLSQKIFNTVGTSNSLGILAAVLLIFSLSDSSLVRKGYFGFLKIPAFFLSLLLLLILNWWILWLVTIAGLIFVMVSSSLTDWRISNYLWPSVVIILAVLSLLLQINLAGFLGVTLPVEIAPSFRTSLEISQETLIKDPLFGTGPENFSLAYDLYKPSSINNTVFWNIRFSEAASELFNTLIAYGLIGFAAFGFLIWQALRAGFRNYSLLAIFATLVTAWVLYPFNVTLGFSFWLVVGLLALTASGKNDELIINLEKSPKHSLITSIFFVGVLVSAVIGFYFTSSRYIANIKFAKAIAAENIDQKTQLLVDALNLNRREDMYSRSMVDLLISRIGQELQNINSAKTAKERQDIISRVQNFSVTAINLANELTQRHGKDATNWFSRALVYENLINVIDGSDQWAIRTYEDYSKLSPKDPLPYLRVGNIYLARADFRRQLNPTNFQNQIIEDLKSAEKNYLKAIELKPNYILAIYNLGVVYEREGRVSDAVRQLELTQSANPLDANIALQLGLLYYRNNQKDKSFTEFQKAITIFPDFSNARWYLALLYEERGQLDNALRELYKIKKLNPDNQILKNKVRELEAGRRSIPPQRVTGVRPLEEQNQK